MPHGGAVPVLPRGVGDVSRYAGTGVPPENLLGDGGGAVAARVVLTAGRPGFTGPLASRTLLRPDGRGDVEERVETADGLTWTVEVEDGAGPVTIRGRPLDRGPERVLATFRTDIAHVDLRISCAAQPGPAAAPDHEAQQLRAYRRLLAPHQEDRLPRVAGR
ncbi:MAG TPA: hypothetical protein VEX86_05005 [Longimicrobium sp.]|nr:hypothetical protein [Longimicrobium sp.]